MILRLTPRTAELIGETPDEWQLLEKQVQAGLRATGPREEEARLRQFAAEFGVPVREKGAVPWKRKRAPPKQAPPSRDG